MKKYILLLLLIGCGKQHPLPPAITKVPGKPAPSCTTASVPEGTKITCPDGTTTLIKNGRDGVDGTNCSVIANSAGAKIYCSDGSNADITNGVKGDQGTVGQTGSIGQTGPSGASITTVKFCADDTSTFPEYGILIGQAIYAVYFGVTPSNGVPQAFLALIKPGAYRSTGGNGCAFTVNADNSITQN